MDWWLNRLKIRAAYYDPYIHLLLETATSSSCSKYHSCKEGSEEKKYKEQKAGRFGNDDLEKQASKFMFMFMSSVKPEDNSQFL